MSRASGPFIPLNVQSRAHPIALVPGTLVATSVRVVPSSFSIADDETQSLYAQVLDQRGNVMPAEVIDTWASDDTDVATVDSNGLVTAVAEGTCTITASSGAHDGTSACTITAS
jgi:uncharacterized protein YjdB